MAKLGSGQRFAALKAKIAAKGNVSNPAAVAAAIGRKKYGKAKFQKMAMMGRHSEDKEMMRRVKSMHGGH